MKFSLDTIIDQRIGFGRYQLRSMILLALIDFNDGAEIIVMTFIVPIIKAEWGLTSAKAATLTSVLFFGAFLGLFFSGKIADIKGRHPSI